MAQLASSPKLSTKTMTAKWRQRPSTPGSHQGRGECDQANKRITWWIRSRGKDRWTLRRNWSTGENSINLLAIRSWNWISINTTITFRIRQNNRMCKPMICLYSPGRSQIRSNTIGKPILDSLIKWQYSPKWPQQGTVNSNHCLPYRILSNALRISNRRYSE